MSNTQDKAICIIGAGAWGGTLAWLLGEHKSKISLWSHDKIKGDEIIQSRKLKTPCELTLSNAVHVHNDLACALEDAELIVMACDSQSMREMMEKIKIILDKDNLKTPVVSVAKGLERGSLLRMSEVLRQAAKDSNYPVCALSGPNLAFEIASGKPAAAVLACDDLEVARGLQKALSCPTFRVYSSDDLVGVELGGTIKNIIAIAAGISDGLNLGINAKSALLTRGLAEMVRLSKAMGAKSSTLWGLSGMGDLFATCQSPLSRNYNIGLQLAAGKSVDEAVSIVKATAEGVETTYAVCELSKNMGIELPIAEQVQATMKGNVTARETIMSLMARPLSVE
ncbi:MAG: NAD(P)-dependent glycerol-3-phosphate dehydrogenase [Candidatus Obscuribacterales bacterium]|nr:NAD(P)-dependent glycerol-3-phosphate dehydrogenase [Candidatus Obscuribacterales bacterium]